jgi:hypothetical protein
VFYSLRWQWKLSLPPTHDSPLSEGHRLVPLSRERLQSSMRSGSIVCHLQINREALELTSLRGVGKLFYDGEAETEKIKGLSLDGKNCRSANGARSKSLLFT